MMCVGWDALDQWGDDVARVERLTGGGVNEVWSVRVNGQLAVARLGRRSEADVGWETELLRHLDREGMTVPVPIPTRDGRYFLDGLVVMTYVEGSPPETEADWRRVAETFRQLHRLTRGWPQRPGWRSSVDFVDVDTATRIDLGAMPPEGVARCRAIWSRLAGAGGGGCSMSGDLVAAGWTRAVRCPRRPHPRQHPHDGRSRRADRLGRVARRCSRPRPCVAVQRRRSRRRHAQRCRASMGRLGRRPLLHERVSRVCGRAAR